MFEPRQIHKIVQGDSFDEETCEEVSKRNIKLCWLFDEDVCLR